MEEFFTRLETAKADMEKQIKEIARINSLQLPALQEKLKAKRQERDQLKATLEKSGLKVSLAAIEGFNQLEEDIADLDHSIKELIDRHNIEVNTATSTGVVTTYEEAQSFVAKENERLKRELERLNSVAIELRNYSMHLRNQHTKTYR